MGSYWSHWTMHNIYLLSHTIKTKSCGRKNVLLLLTMYPLWCYKGWQPKKTKHIQTLRFHEGRDGHCWPAQWLYTVRFKSNRWDLVALYNISHAIRVNSKTLYCIKKGLDVKKQNISDLAFELAKTLTTPLIEQQWIEWMDGLGKGVIRKSTYIIFIATIVIVGMVTLYGCWGNKKKGFLKGVL